MPLWVVLAFALVLSVPDGPPYTPALAGQVGSLLAAFCYVVVCQVVAFGGANTCLRDIQRGLPLEQVQHKYSRLTSILWVVLLGGFGAVMLLTNYAAFIGSSLPQIPFRVVHDLLALSPFLIALVLQWIVLYPADRTIRRAYAMLGQSQSHQHGQVWSINQYLAFNIRYQLLLVALPMVLILVVRDVIECFRDPITQAFGWVYAPDAALAAGAGVVFLVAPLILRYIWYTHPLPADALRAGLADMCRQLRLGYRDILVWRTGGVIANAAVMGLCGPVRYILLSDALLSYMTTAQIRSVFAHEAGHVRRHHIFFLAVFAGVTIGWIGIFDMALRMEMQLGDDLLQLAGLPLVLVCWGVFFGPLSRMFERQADLFAVECTTADVDICMQPCPVHNPELLPDDQPEIPSWTHQQHRARLCTTASYVFATALERVAALNGVSRSSRNWRHGTIRSRCVAVMSLAMQPGAYEQFQVRVRVVKLLLLGAMVAGFVVGVMLLHRYQWLPEYVDRLISRLF